MGVRDILSTCIPHRLWVIAALLAACLGSPPTQVQAGCGDYVMVTGTSNPDADHTGHAASDRRQSPSGLPVCHGPDCRQRRDVPASPPNRITLDEHSWGWIPVVTQPASFPGQYRVRQQYLVRAMNVSCGIFRPPRPMADA